MQYEKWHDNYNIELVEMFYIMINIVKIEYPDMEVNLEPAFCNFSRLIYHSSSKEFSMYTIKESLNISEE